MNLAIYFLLLAGAALLVAAVRLAGVPVAPDMIVCAIPVAIFILLVSFAGTSAIKRPAWLTLPLAFGMWGGAGGQNAGGGLGCALCMAGFAAIGVALGLGVERRRAARVVSHHRGANPNAEKEE